MRVCCVIPAYQEAPYIARVVEAARSSCVDVVVVDDGSTDHTGAIAAAHGAIVVRHFVNRGKGAALRTGFAKALELGADVIVTVDGDGQHDPRLISHFLRALQQGDADLVLGSRRFTRSGTMPVARQLSNGMTTCLLRLLYRIHVTDSQSGFRAFRRRVLESIETRSNGFSIETECLIATHRMGFRITEVTIPTCYGTEKSKVYPPRDVPDWIFSLIRGLMHSKRNATKFMVRQLQNRNGLSSRYHAIAMKSTATSPP